MTHDPTDLARDGKNMHLPPPPTLSPRAAVLLAQALTHAPELSAWCDSHRDAWPLIERVAEVHAGPLDEPTAARCLALHLQVAAIMGVERVSAFLGAT